MSPLEAYDSLEIATALLAAFGSAFVRGLTGFGMAILLVPILALALSPLEAVILANCLSFAIGVLEIRRLVRDCEGSAWWISGLVVATTPLGLIGLAATSPGVARVAIALIGLSAFVAIILPRGSGAKPGALATGGVGLMSGLMTGYAGMPGPPVVPYYVRRSIDRQTAKASMMLIFTIAAAAGLVSGAAIGALDLRLPLLAAMLFPAVLVGNALGNRFSGRIADRVWRALVAIVLGGAALAAVLRLV